MPILASFSLVVLCELSPFGYIDLAFSHKESVVFLYLI